MCTYRLAVVIAALGLTAVACGRGGAPAAPPPEAPPPPIEAELAPGSRLVEPRAQELVQQMSDRLARASSLAIEAEELYDEVPPDAPRRQLTSARRVAMRRPDRLVGDASGDARNRSFWYDGRTFSALDREQHVWASGEVPPTIDAALDWVFDQTGTVIPLADFLFTDVYDRLMGNVQRGVYLGIHEAAGRALPSPVVRTGDHRLAALDRRGPRAVAAQAGHHVQDRGRSAAVLGHDPHMESRSQGAGGLVPVHPA